MNSSEKPLVVIVSLQVQSSFQAIPLGAACVVSSLRADPAIASRASILLADYSLEDDDLAGLDPGAAGCLIAEKVVALIGKNRPQSADVPVVVGFSVYVWNRPVIEAAACRFRELVPGAALFAGGPEVTASPESFVILSHTLAGQKRPLFDRIIAGEGESASAAFVLSVLDGKPAGLSADSSPRCPPEDCNRLPSPWLDGTLDDCPGVRDYRGALWELARGCPYSCAYCYESKGEKKVRNIPLARLEKELERFVERGTERVFVLDPTYNASRDRALSLLRLIEKKAGEIHFNFEVRAELLDRELVDAFSRIPCSLQIGLQSTNPEALALVNRPVDLKQFAKKIALLNDSGIVFGIDLMYGLPGDTLSSFRSSVDYAVGLYPNNLEIFRLAVLPGTTLSDKAASYGLKYQAAVPYLVEATPKFPAQDLERAAALARACDVFYTQGRAVTWFLSALAPLKLKPSQVFQDFARYLDEHRTGGKGGLADCADLPHVEAERLQLAFLKAKYAEKGKAFLWPALNDVIRLNGAWTRALAEGEETRLTLTYHPEDLFSSDSMDLEFFTENACMENCSVRVFPGPDGPDFEVA
jgi:radical SAM superfamily enzyme YgiQ (UPF0313 family)